MPIKIHRQKYDESGEINRTYPIKCPKCREEIYVSSEDFTCKYCQTSMCPECLKIGTIITRKGSNSNGDWGQTDCANCGYEISSW